MVLRSQPANISLTARRAQQPDRHPPSRPHHSTTHAQAKINTRRLTNDSPYQDRGRQAQETKNVRHARRSDEREGGGPWVRHRARSSPRGSAARGGYVCDDRALHASGRSGVDDLRVDRPSDDLPWRRLRRPSRSRIDRDREPGWHRFLCVRSRTPADTRVCWPADVRAGPVVRNRGSWLRASHRAATRLLLRRAVCGRTACTVRCGGGRQARNSRRCRAIPQASRRPYTAVTRSSLPLRIVTGPEQQPFRQRERIHRSAILGEDDDPGSVWTLGF